MEGTANGAVCPSCRKPAGRRLPVSISAGYVAYLRCDECGHIWTINTATGEKIVDVTPRRDSSS